MSMSPVEGVDFPAEQAVEAVDPITIVDGLLSDLDSLKKEVNSLRADIFKAEKRKAQCEAELRDRQEGLIKTLKQLDVHSQHNMGWEGRVSDFLIALRRKIKTTGA